MTIREFIRYTAHKKPFLPFLCSFLGLKQSEMQNSVLQCASNFPVSWINKNRHKINKLLRVTHNRKIIAIVMVKNNLISHFYRNPIGKSVILWCLIYVFVKMLALMVLLFGLRFVKDALFPIRLISWIILLRNCYLDAWLRVATCASYQIKSKWNINRINSILGDGMWPSWYYATFLSPLNITQGW